MHTEVSKNPRRICTYFNTFYGCKRGRDCEFFHITFLENEREFDLKEWDAQEGDRVEYSRNICTYYNTDFGCRYFKKECRRIHIKGSLMLSRRLMWETRAKNFVIELDDNIDPEKVKRIKIYDFDKTLFQTFDKPSGLKEYKRVTGREWPHGQKYYGTPFSMKHPLLPKKGPKFEECLEDLKGNDLIIMMTGRDFGFYPVIDSVLRRFGLNIPVYVFKPHGWKLGTKWYKVSFIKYKLLQRFHKCEAVEMYEDRIDHAKQFQHYLSDLEGITDFRIHIATDVPFQINLLRENNHFVDTLVICKE